MSRDFSKALAENICRYRKIANLTHEMLAMLVGVAAEKVREWESNKSLPHAGLLPDIARVLGVSIEELYGLRREARTPPSAELPWEDDNKLRAVIYKGRRLVECFDESVRSFTFTYEGEALNVESWCDIYCGLPDFCSGTMGIKGNAVAGFNIYCGNINGNASAGRDINCRHILQNATAGRDVNCSGLGGMLKAGRSRKAL
ncbi:MAG TPA: helix-turn-helix transcriptional regulator [Clostridiales bacterium]|nr:helix-turn-helix transcriptional regulator [Clostridiales bacterium]